MGKTTGKTTIKMGDGTWLTSRQLREKVPGLAAPTLARWTAELRDTNMVKREGRRNLYSVDFVHFIARRKGRGPANLPPAVRIADLYAAVRAQRHAPPEQLLSLVAQDLAEDELVIRAQLKQLDLLPEEQGVSNEA
ncbi:MAG: hypothetical protein M0R06_23595 [Sphaerochaeta sp.]|nr:hypothetical protein [Sphaerochaeta sp.]